MNKKILLLGSLFLANSLFAQDNVVTNTLVTCDNGAPGFQTVISNSGTDKTVRYNSCNSDGIGVYNGSGDKIASGNTGGSNTGGSNTGGSNTGGSNTGGSNSGGAETVNVNGEDIYFPAGYTPTEEVNKNNCVDGITVAHEWGCQNKLGESLNESWLTVNEVAYLDFDNNPNLADMENLSNLTKVSYYANFRGVPVDDLSGLRNLTTVEGRLSLGGMPNLTDISGLNNITSVTNCSSSYKYCTGSEATNPGKAYISLDNKTYDKKLDSDSYLCNEGLSKVRIRGVYNDADKKAVICN